MCRLLIKLTAHMADRHIYKLVAAKISTIHDGILPDTLFYQRCNKVWYIVQNKAN